MSRAGAQRGAAGGCGERAQVNAATPVDFQVALPGSPVGHAIARCGTGMAALIHLVRQRHGFPFYLFQSQAVDL